MTEEEMIENVEHCIKNFNGRMVDCIAVGDMYKKYLEQKSEIEIHKENFEGLSADITQVLKDLDLSEETIIADEMVNEIKKKFVNKEEIIKEKALHQDYLVNAAVTSNKALDAHFREKERYVIQVLDKLLGEDKIGKSE